LVYLSALLFPNSYTVRSESCCALKRFWICFSWTIVSKSWIKQLHTLPVLHFNHCSNWIQWNNSTFQWHLRNWQPNLHTIAQWISECLV
jgi:hypothetical protein